MTGSINIDIVVITREPTNYTHLAIGPQMSGYILIMLADSGRQPSNGRLWEHPNYADHQQLSANNYTLHMEHCLIRI